MRCGTTICELFLPQHMILKMLYDPNNPLPNSEAVDLKVKELEKMYVIWKVLPQQALQALPSQAQVQVSVVVLCICVLEVTLGAY